MVLINVLRGHIFNHMNIKKTLEKIVSPIRLGWQGVLVSGAAAAVAYFSDNSMVDSVAYFSLGVGSIFYWHSLKAFMRTSKNVKKYETLDERFIEPHMFWYCNRQGVRTAAANYNMAEDFDRIMDNYDKDMMLTFIPHI